jgi:hypothetical protein
MELGKSVIVQLGASRLVVNRYLKKLKPDGTIDKYKARLVAKGFTQKEGEDFFDTYSPITRLTTICVLDALAAFHGLLIHQMDVKIAFLNGELDEEIYMQ